MREGKKNQNLRFEIYDLRFKNQKSKIKNWYWSLIIGSLVIFAGIALADTLTDNSQSAFNAGTHTGTQWDSGNSWLEWDGTIPWELPNNASSTGWMDMTDNVLLMHMNEAGWNGTANEVVDSSGSGHHGVATGNATTTTNGKMARAGIFDGASYVDLGTFDAMNIGNQEITMSAWVYNTGVSHLTDYIFIKGNDLINGHSYGIAIGYTYNVATMVSTDTYVYWASSPNSAIQTNQWHHVVGVIDGNQVKLYLDGVWQDTVTSVGSVSSSTDPVKIGAQTRSGYEYYFNGKIDEVAVWDIALTDTQVQTLYARQAPNYLGRFDSRILNAGASTTWNTVGWTPQRPLYKELPNSLGIETAYNAGNVDMTGNKLLLHMNEASWNGTANEVTDHSGEGNHGTSYNGANTIANGKLSRGSSYDGINDYVKIAEPMPASLRPSEFTISAWVNPAAYSNSHGDIVAGIVASQYDDAFACYSMMIDYRNDGSHGGVQGGIHFQVGTGSGYWTTGSQGTTNVPLPLNEWTHVVVMAKPNDVYRVYFNGALVADWVAGGSIGYNDNCSLNIGWNDQTSTPQNRYFNGSVDEVAIWGRILSPTEILDHYLRGATRLKYQVRSCNDAACSGETFIGPDGTADTYYSELSNTGLGLPSLTLTNVPDNQYFQYRAFLESDNTSYSPELKSVTLTNDVESGLSSQAGISNSPPAITVTVSDGGSAALTPTNVGSNVTFTATAKDANTDQYYLAICKTDAITAGNDTAPTCATDQTWAITPAGSPVNSNSEATLTYTALAGDAESNAWYAFACDKVSGGGACYPNTGSGDQGRAVGIITFTGVPADTDYITVDSKVYEFDTDNNYTGGRTQVNIAFAVSGSDVAEALAEMENGVSSRMTQHANIIYVYADTAGTAGNSIGMTEGQDTNSKIDFSGATLTGGDDDNASPFYVNHAGTFGTVTITDVAESVASVDYPDFWGVTLYTVDTGPSAYASHINLVLTDDNATDCIAETAASLAALIIGSSPDFTLTCDLDDSLQSGANPVTGTRLAAAITDGTGTTFDDAVTAVTRGSGDTVMTPGTIELNQFIEGIPPGTTMGFTLPFAEISDPDGNDMIMHICTAETTGFDYSANTCTGGVKVCSSTDALMSGAVDPADEDAWCTGGADLISVPTAHSEEVGEYDFKVYVEDVYNGAATGTNTQSYAVANVYAELVEYVSWPASINPPAGGSENVVYTVALSDGNGDYGFDGVIGWFFDDSSTTFYVGDGCVGSELDCYNVAECEISNQSTPGTGKLALGTDAEYTATCTIPVWFNANESDGWEISVTVDDNYGDIGTPPSDVNISNPPLLGIEIENVATIAYGIVAVGMASDSVETSMANKGNQTMDIYLAGNPMCTDYPTCSGNTIDESLQKWHHNNPDFVWSDTATAPGPYTLQLNASGTDDETGCLNRTIAIRSDHTSAAANESIYWRLGIPDNQATGTYIGANAFTATLGDTCETGQSY